MKKLLCLFLSFVMLISILMLTACGERGNETNTTKAKVEEDTTKQYADDLPATLNFNNEEISFLVAEPTSFNTRGVKINDYVVGTNAVDDAIFARNAKMEERLKVVITMQSAGAINLASSQYYTDLNSGTSNYDVISGWMSYDTALATKGIVLDLNKLEDYNADYIDMSQAYWSKTFIDATKYAGIQYWISGDLALTYLSGMFPCFVNTGIYADAIAGTYGDIYQIVRNKQWTYEKMMEMAEMVYADTGKVAGKTDEDDMLGYTCNIYDEFYGMLYGAGIKVSERDPGGNPCIIFQEEDNGVLEFVGYLNQLYKSDYTIMQTEGQGGSIFAKDKTLFSVTKLQYAETAFSAMENFGIIPAPMLNESIGHYTTSVTGHLNTFGIYSGCQNIPAAAALLEALAAESMRSVTPAYYDMALKYRYTRDEDSAEMIDLIHDSIYIDFAFAWRNVVGGGDYFTDSFLRSVYTKAPNASSIKTAHTTWENNLEKFLEDLEEIAGR